ncbi:MAG: hypothetical protein ACLQGP_35220 [Isosphaeraceae bacterium]
MTHKKGYIAEILQQLDLGCSIAESDEVLEAARIETSVYSDLLADRVDLIPGTKGSGKSALYRIFTNFLPAHLLEKKGIVVAHGISNHGNEIFHVFRDRFNTLSEDKFVEFWFIYFVSLIHSDFIENPQIKTRIISCKKELDKFRGLCKGAKIPEIEARRTFKDRINWVLGIVTKLRPSFKVNTSDNLSYEF